MDRCLQAAAFHGRWKSVELTKKAELLEHELLFLQEHSHPGERRSRHYFAFSAGSGSASAIGSLIGWMKYIFFTDFCRSWLIFSSAWSR